MKDADVLKTVFPKPIHLIPSIEYPRVFIVPLPAAKNGCLIETFPILRLLLFTESP